MSKARFIYNNLITDESMIAVSSLRTGVVTSAKKEGSGSAVMISSGDYSGTSDKEYIIEIDSVAAGAEIGQATFRWSNGGGSWNASGVATSLAAILLENGVYVNWTAGSGDDFVIADKWYFKGINLFSANAMIDLDRDHRYRSAALGAPNTITITLTAEQLADALIIYDHNLTSAATIALWGDDAATFDSDGGAAQVIEAVTWAADKILHYLSTVDRTKKYWQLRITDAANPDGYIEIGEIFLGSYTELSANYVEGYSKGHELLFNENKTPFGVSRKRFYNKQRHFQFDFNYIPLADVTLLEGLLEAITNRSSGKLNPVFFNDDSAIPANTWMVDITAMPENHETRGYYSVPLSMLEVMESI